MIGGDDRDFYRLDRLDHATRESDDVVVGGDSEPPTVTVTVPADGSTLLLGEAATVDYRCEDESTVVGCVGDLAVGTLLDTSVPGQHSFTVIATDARGNTGPVTVNYRVVYRFGGFEEPVGDDMALAQAGRTIPLTWTLTGAADPVESSTAVVRVASTQVACDSQSAPTRRPRAGG